MARPASLLKSNDVMHRFWTRYINPLIEAAAPRRMIEVGAEFGWNTEKILGYCRAHGCFLDVVDPMPHPALHQVLAHFPDEHRYHPLKSIDAFPLLPAADLVLLDGDHNWFTVYTEFQLIFARVAGTAAAPPIVIMHDVAWPYARRDMYYSPGDIAPANRHPYASRGMRPGVAGLVDDGLNGRFFNAMQEGGLQNGVLTAVEDFIAAWPHPIRFVRLPFHNGLGIVIPEARATPEILAVIESFFKPDALLAACEDLERDAMSVRADVAELRQKLIQRSEALVRARGRILELEQALSATRP